MPEWVVSMHGRCAEAGFHLQSGDAALPLGGDRPSHLIQVPEGMRMYFCVSEGEILTDVLGW